MGERRLKWSQDVAWVHGDDALTLALLPDGPVVVAQGIDVLLDHLGGDFSVDELVRDARESHSDSEAQISGLRRAVDDLLNLGLLQDKYEAL